VWVTQFSRLQCGDLSLGASLFGLWQVTIWQDHGPGASLSIVCWVTLAGHFVAVWSLCGSPFHRVKPSVRPH
jgi:hypothetical protein